MQETARSSHEKTLQGLGDTVYDVLVVGGGITGAGIARESAWDGLKTLLIEKSDFASGTSSRSSKLLHGGLRYLEQYDFALVSEAVRERMAGFRLAQHLVRPMPFIFPQYKGDRPGMFLMSMGLWLYDAMAGFRSFGLHKRLSRARTLELAPGLRDQGLNGSFRYFDAQTDDARLTLEIILDAEELGASVLSWVNLKSAEKVGDLWCCNILDRISNRRFEIKTRTIAAAPGPWLDRLAVLFDPEAPRRMRLTKGVHVLVAKSRLPLPETVVILNPDDGRVTFAIPTETGTLIGTTDTDFETPEREPGVTDQDIQYLLDGVNATFPEAHLVPEDVFSTYSGLRPLLDEVGATTASDVSREHSVFKLADHVFAIAGGKLTTWRVMAHDLMKSVRRDLKAGGKDPRAGRQGSYRALRARLLPGGVGIVSREALAAQVPVLSEKWGISLRSAETVLFTYGAHSERVLAYASQRPDGLAPVGSIEVPLGAFAYAVEYEHAHTLDDLLRRRSRIFYTESDQGQGAAEKVARSVAAIVGWGEDDLVREQKHYRSLCHGSSAHDGDATLIPGAQDSET